MLGRSRRLAALIAALPNVTAEDVLRVWETTELPIPIALRDHAVLPVSALDRIVTEFVPDLSDWAVSSV